MTRITLLTLVAVVLPAAHVRADEPTTNPLEPLAGKVRLLVQKHYPEAVVEVRDRTICLEFNTRQFMIHERGLTGQWNDARQVRGPERRGIYGELELRSGEYSGMAVVPQSFDKYYFTLLVLAPYSAELDQHLYVRLRYPEDVSPEFLAQFRQMAEGFGKHLPETALPACHLE